MYNQTLGLWKFRETLDQMFVITSVMLYSALVVAGAASESADPHFPAAAVSSHVPPRHPFPRRPAEDNTADAAWDGGMLEARAGMCDTVVLLP